MLVIAIHACIIYFSLKLCNRAHAVVLCSTHLLILYLVMVPK